MLNKTFLLASAVLNLVEAILSDDVEGDLIVYTFKNGRENGFAFIGKDVCICFANQKNSDDVVVYEWNDWDFCTLHPKVDDDWLEKAKYFKTADTAAQYLCERIEELSKNNQLF